MGTSVTRRSWRHLPWPEIRAAWLQVESVRELAERYGMSETTLSSRAHRAGWGKRKRGRKPRVDRAQFAETWTVTRSPARVALEVGITREAAHRLRPLGWGCRRKRCGAPIRGNMSEPDQSCGLNPNTGIAASSANA